MRLRTHTLAIIFLMANILVAQGNTPAGSISGKLIDEADGSNVAGATVITRSLAKGAQESENGTKVAVTDRTGRFVLEAMAAGDYAIRFFKAGYQLVEIERVVVVPGEDTTLNYPLQATVAAPSEASGSDIFELAAFQVTAEALSKKERVFFDLRTAVSTSVDFLSLEDLQKFAASDMADAIKRVPGVNVQEGKFAVIRGLDERYTSTLLNNMAIPSPDPDRQSPQLDLFPSEVVSSLSVAKSFSQELPGNSAGGSINISTSVAPEKFQLKVGGGTGFNDNAHGTFYEAQRGTSIARLSGDDQWEYDFGVDLGMPFTVLGRPARFNLNVSTELDFETRSGFSHSRSPQRSVLDGVLRDENGSVVRDENGDRVFKATLGDFAKGELSLSDGIWDTDVSSRSERLSAFATVGLNFDDAGKHTIDLVTFATSNDEETADFRSNRRFPGLDGFTGTDGEFRAAVAAVATPGRFVVNAIRDDNDIRQADPFSQFFASSNFFRERDFRVVQLFGKHDWEFDDNNLVIKWAADAASTSQAEESSRFTYWWQPEGSNEAAPDADGVFRTTGGQSGGNPIFFSANDVEEDQVFGRVDLEYGDLDAGELAKILKTGIYYEDASRDAEASYANRLVGSADFAAVNSTGATAEELEAAFLENGDGYNFQVAGNDASREIMAGYLGVKIGLTAQLDFLAGVRREEIRIQSNNDPFTGQLDFTGISGIFPTKFLMFEVIDDAAYDGFGVVLESFETSNAKLLGIPVPVDENGIVNLSETDLRGLLQGDINEGKTLPSAGLVWRPRTGMRVLANYSDTVARPSFREISYYLSAAPDSDDLVIGNPQLGVSEVRSYDLRVEYVSGDNGDLFAISGFAKELKDPIEKITLADPLTRIIVQTFFNNENSADLSGVELEARKNLGFIGPEWLGHFSLGGNFTYIDASVRRPQAEIERMQQLFVLQQTGAGLEARPDPDADPRFLSLPEERKLFNQPEWIANADLSFEHEDWGTTATLSVFAISEVLASAGSITLDPFTRIPQEAIPDRYIGSYLQWDLVLQQKWRNWSFKFSIKNLTDTTRTSHYDSELIIPEIESKRFKVGRDFSISASYSF